MSNSIVGAKKKERKPRIAVDSAASISTAKLLYGLAEGEVYGLADGAKSIRLDGTPLVDDNGNGNFNGVRWTFAAGTNDQEHISGFPDVTNEVGVGVELKSSQPWVKAFNDTQLSAVRVRFKWGRLSKTNPDNGDVNGHTIKYAIDLQTDGGAYHEIINTKIQEKTSAGYERTHRIDLPKAKTGWQLRVRRLTPNDPSEYVQDTMMIEAVAEVIDVKLSYPNTALLGIEYNAEIFSSVAKIAVRVKGKIIRVPDNYDPVARTYTGIWTGNFKDAYSNNPAWVFYDLCTQWRGGLGERLDATMIDRWSLYALGQYCDQQVSDGQGGLEPRFTCNVYLQKQEEAYTVLQNIAGIFRAMSFWTGERIMLDADVPQDSIYTYSSANIVGGVAGIQYSGTRNRDRHTLAKVAWDNPNNDYQTEYEYIRDEKAMSKFGVKVLDLSAFGCTSQAQAQRAGLWALKTEQLETRQVTFSVGLDGAIPRVGNIISLSDEAFAGRANGGRVSTVNGTQRIIELDREVTASVGDVLIINGGSGKSERRNISNVVGNRITVTAGFTSAEPEHVWAIETADLKLMRFRVMSITENDDATYAITAIQHEPQKYDAIDFGTDVKPTDITIVNPDTVDAPDTVNIESRHREVQGQTVTTLVISWAQVSGAVAYDVEWRKDDGTWIKLPRTGNVSAEVEGVYSGNYLARVRSVSAFEVQSQATTSILTEVKGKVGLPPAVVGLTATGVLFGMDLKWGFQAGSGDAAFTEIQVGSAPNVNVATLTQVSYPTNTHAVTGLQGNLKQSYRARIVDKLGLTSVWSAWVTGTTDNSVDKVMDLIQGQIDESSLNQALTSKIEKIDTNSSSIDGIDTELDKAKADIAAADKVIAANKAEAANAVAATNAEIADSKLLIDANKAKLVLTDAEVAEAKTKVTALETDYNGNKTSVSNALIVLTNKDKSLASDLSTLTASYGASETKLVQDLKVLADKDVALNSLITALDSEYETNKASVSSSLDTLTNKDTALTNSITDLTAVVGTNTAAITAEATARADADRTITSSVTTLKSDYDANKASVTNSLSTLTSKDTALTNSIDALTTRVGTAEGTIISNNTALVNKDTALTNSLNALTTDYDGNKTTVSNSLSALSTADTALGNRITATDAIAKNAQSRVGTAETAISNATSAIAQQKTDITAAFEAIDDIEVGGRNFALDSKDEVTIINRELEESFIKTYNISEPLVAGEDYIISFWYIAEVNVKGVQAIVIDSNGKHMPSSLFSPTPTYKRAIFKFTAREGIGSSQQIRLDHEGSTSQVGVRVWVKEVQLEKGNTVSDWTEAPETTGELITANKASIKLNEKAISDANRSIASSVSTLRAETNALEGGSTNLIENSKDLEGYPFRIGATTMFGDFRVAGVKGSRDSKDYEDAISVSIPNCVSEYYTASFYARATANGHRITCYFYSPSTTIEAVSSQGESSNSADGGIDITLTTSWKKYWIKWKHPSLEGSKRVIIGRSRGAVSSYIAAPIMTEGTIVPSWSESLSSAIQTVKEVKATTDGLSAQYTVKLDVGGRVSGFGLASSTTQSDFAVNADKFYIAPPTGSSKGISPFMVLTSPRTINGTSVPAGTYIESAFIHNGSIDTLQVKNGAITTAKIGNLQVDTAQIANGAIETAKIGNLAVDTLQIADHAVTIPRNKSISGSFDTYVIEQEVEIELLTVTMNLSSGHSSISFGYTALEAKAGGNDFAGDGTVIIRIKRGNEVLASHTHYRTGDYILDGETRASMVYDAMTYPFIIDVPPSTGMQTYTVTVESIGLNGGRASARSPVKIFNPSLLIIGTKK